MLRQFALGLALAAGLALPFAGSSDAAMMDGVIALAQSVGSGHPDRQGAVRLRRPTLLLV